MLPSRCRRRLLHERRTRASNCRATPQSVNCWRCSLPRSRANGRILELGTGCGVGLAWITHGLEGRADVEVVTIFVVGPEAIAVARFCDWPSFVSIVEGDAVTVSPTVGEFDLVFADAEGGKWERLDLTLAAVRLHGVLIVDDMTTGAVGERAASLQDSRGEGSPAVRCPVRERRDHAGRGDPCRRGFLRRARELSEIRRGRQQATGPPRSCNRICFGQELASRVVGDGRPRTHASGVADGTPRSRRCRPASRRCPRTG